MWIPSGDLYQLARVRYEDRLSEAAQRLAVKQLRGKPKSRTSQRLGDLVVLVGMALLPLGESLRAPLSDSRSLDISTQ